MWYAKPAGTYTFSSVEGKSNCFEISDYLSAKGYRVEAIAGILGNMMGESGLNPWIWQYNTMSLNSGYGLFQFTPAKDYINGCKDVPFYAPNLSVTQVTAGALPTDGIAQLEVFDVDRLIKWKDGCWRTYWDKTKYATEWQRAQQILLTYGNGSRLTMSEFRGINDLYDATFAFMACFEGPEKPTIAGRYANARLAYEVITGERPPEPTPTKRKKMPLYMYLRRIR